MAGLVTTEDRAGTYYFPLAQDVERTITLVARTEGEPTSVTSAIRQQLRAIDPELPLYNVQPMEQRMSESLTDRRTPMVLALVFATVALFLAAIGIYGVLAYQVSQRTKEIGIRLALGGDARSILTLILKEGLVLLAAGFVVGIAGAFAIRRTLEAQLFGIGAMDPMVLASVGAVLGSVALMACLVPARRAAATNPLTALNLQ